jgi:hypothetical protein
MHWPDRTRRTASPCHYRPIIAYPIVARDAALVDTKLNERASLVRDAILSQTSVKSARSHTFD